MRPSGVKVHTGRLGIALRGHGTGVICWPHANALKGPDGKLPDGVVLFQIRPNCTKPCNVCAELAKEKIA